MLWHGVRSDIAAQKLIHRPRGNFGIESDDGRARGLNAISFTLSLLLRFRRIGKGRSVDETVAP